MKDALHITYRFFPGVPKQPPFPVSLDNLDVVMAVANRHFSTNPERQLGGPTMPAKEPK